MYADLDLDPGTHGVQSFEATDFLLYRRQIDPTSALILWQAGRAPSVRRCALRTLPRKTIRPFSTLYVPALPQRTAAPRVMRWLKEP